MRYCVTAGCATAAAVDLLLCWYHRNRLAVDARDAAELYDELLDLAALGTGSGDSGQRVRGGEEKLGLDLDPRLVDVRDDIAGVLASWCSIIVERRRPPVIPETVRGYAMLIGRHASWLAGHEAAGDVSSELSDLVVVAGALVQRDQEQSVRTLDGLVCPTCSGPVRAIMRRSTSLVASRMACELDDGHQWLPHEWAELAAPATDDELVDAAVAGAALGYPPERAADNVYHLARRGRLARVDTTDGPRYRLREVQELAQEWAA